MKFTSIKEVIEKTKANAKAAECLGKSGALNYLEENLNEVEAAEYARELVDFFRKKEKYENQQEKYEEIIKNKEEEFRRKIEERKRKQEIKEIKYQQELIKYEEKLKRITEINSEETKKKIKEPKKPIKPKQLKEIDYPKLSSRPIAPSEPVRPRIILSTRERLRLQRELLHVYISGHPLDEVPKKEEITEIRNIGEGDKSLSSCTIQGVLQLIKISQTRNKKMMAKLRIEDKTGSIEVVVFPRLYELLKGTLIEGELYEVLGKIDITRKESDDGEEFTHAQLIGTKVHPIRIGSDKEWDILYPLLKGTLRILPSRVQKSKGIATMTIMKQYKKQ